MRDSRSWGPNPSYEAPGRLCIAPTGAERPVSVGNRDAFIHLTTPTTASRFEAGAVLATKRADVLIVSSQTGTHKS